jgi:SNF2 family DNA or RNA helicase
VLKPDPSLRFDSRLVGYSYQLDAVEAARKLPYAALFHEQGLGKTKIGIDLALEWLRAGDVDSVMIITKRGLVANWEDEIRLHSYLTPRVLDQQRRATFFSLNSPARLYLTHYEVMTSERRRLALFLKTRRVAVILDESHKIKNPLAEVTRALHDLSPLFARRVIMTGTPVANRPYDIWAQVYFLDGGNALGRDFDEMKRTLDLSNALWADPIRRQEFETELARVFERIRAFSIRETKNSVAIDLPAKRVENIPVGLAPRQLALYHSYRDTLRAEITRDGHVVADDAEATLKRLLRLVQVASNPMLVDGSYAEEPAKYPVLLDLLRRASSRSEKCIVWTNFVANAEWLHSRLSAWNAVVVHGAIGIDERNAALKRFKEDSECRVLVATPGSAKEGLTLTVANHAVFFDRSFSLDDYLQAQDRIHRISQQRECFVWNLIAKDTIDEWVDALLVAKRLAAQLAQADISEGEYQKAATYDFGRLIAAVLESGNSDDGINAD